MKTLIQLALVALLVCINCAPFTSGQHPTEPSNYSTPYPTTMYPMTTEEDDDDDEDKKGMDVSLDVMGKFYGTAKLNLTDKKMAKIWKKWEEDWKDMAKKMMMMKNEVEMWKMAEDVLGKKGAMVVMACMKGKKMEDEDNWGEMKKEMGANWVSNVGMGMDMDDDMDMSDMMGDMMSDMMGDTGNWGDMGGMDMGGMGNWGDMGGMGNWGDMGDMGDMGGDGEKMMEDPEKKMMKFKKCMKGIMEKKKMMMKMMMHKMCMMRKMLEKMMWKKKMMMMKDGSLFGGAERVAPVTLMLSVLGLSAHVFYF